MLLKNAENAIDGTCEKSEVLKEIENKSKNTFILRIRKSRNFEDI